MGILIYMHDMQFCLSQFPDHPSRSKLRGITCKNKPDTSKMEAALKSNLWAQAQRKSHDAIIVFNLKIYTKHAF
jgi:hypothetical protein